MSEASPTGSSSGTAVVSREGNRPQGSGPATPLQTSQGNTTIDDTVVTKVAGIAAREVRGVHELGGGVGRALAGVTLVLLVILALAGIVLAVFCIGTGTSGPSLGGLASLLSAASVRDSVGGWLGQLEAGGPVAVIAGLSGLAAMALGLLLLAGLLHPRGPT